MVETKRKQEMARIGLGQEDRDSCRSVTSYFSVASSRRNSGVLCNSDLKIGGGLRRNRGGVQRGGVRPPAHKK